jgi:DNA helicase TIP49 (TBP-interacting protein)
MALIATCVITTSHLRRKLTRILKQWSLNWLLAKILFIDEISMMDIMDFLTPKQSDKEEENHEESNQKSLEG